MQPQQLIPLIDLTLLDNNATASHIEQLCSRAQTKFGPVAAVCIEMHFLPLAKKILAGSGIKFATVCNFPSGNLALEVVLDEISRAIDLGADEIDCVMPYQAFLSGNVEYTKNYLQQVRRQCSNKTLKVILESGAFSDFEKLKSAAELVIASGANFLKTSTGKIAQGASPEAAKIILQAIKASGKEIGFKVSGGVRTEADAMIYVNCVKAILGENHLTPNLFRIGASQLLNELILKTNRF